MAISVHDERHEHRILTDLLGAVLAVFIAVLVLAVAVAAGGFAFHWAWTLGA